MTPVETPILIVGAGTTGLTLACELARHGAALRIVDKLPGVVHTARATGIHSRTLEVFQDLDVVDEILADAQPIRGVNQYANGERFSHLRFDAVDSPYPFTVGLEQWRTEEVLEALLGRLGVRVERGTELVDMQEHRGCVQAMLRRADGGEESVETPWIVGCDGVHSRVRHLGRERFPGEEDPRQYVLGDVRVETPPEPDEIHMYLGDRGVLFFFPLPAGRSLVVGDIAQHHDGKTETPQLEEIQAIVSERGATGARVRDPRWLSYFRIHYRVGRHYRHGRILLAGDAVHVHSPVGGQGMNTGIQDAYNLAWKLALVCRGFSSPVLLDSYERERRAVAEDVVRVTKAMTDRATVFRDLSDSERERLYLHAVVPEVERLRGTRHDQELDLDYRRSPICSEPGEHGEQAGGLAGRPHAGAQALDAAPLWLGDRELSLFELLRGPRHTLLLFPGSHDGTTGTALAGMADAVRREYSGLVDVHWVAPPDTGDSRSLHSAALRDPQGTLHQRYAARSECLYLIRPDGYVGYRSARAALGPLRAHLARVFSASLC